MTMTTQASEASARVRSARCKHRANVAGGTVTLRQLLIDQEIPYSVSSVRAFDVAAWPFAWSLNATRASPVRLWLQRLNYAAIRDGGVNIFEDIGRLNPTQLEWLVSYVEQNPAVNGRRKAAA